MQISNILTVLGLLLAMVTTIDRLFYYQYKMLDKSKSAIRPLA